VRRDLQQARRLELDLARLRWLAGLYCLVQTALEVVGDRSDGSIAWPLGGSLTVALLLGNVLISRAARRAGTEFTLRAVGAIAFVLDTVVVLGFVWIAAETPSDPSWALGYLIPLEGAVRFGVPGALAAVPVLLISEWARELWLAERLPRYAFQGSAVAFRVGMAAVIAMVAGLFASSIRRETERARERTHQAEEAAALAEHAAQREGKARRDLVAFHTAILAGVATDDPSEGIQAIAEAVGRELECDSLGVLLLDQGEGGVEQLVAAGVWGDPGYERGTRFVRGTEPMNIEELTRPALRKDPPEVVVPMKTGGGVIGILHERSNGGAFDRERVLLLGRLADQVSLVVQATNLRMRQEDTLARLRELDEMKSDFVAITSHELRTPLSSVRGFVDSLLRRMDDLSREDIQEYLEIIQVQSDRLIRLVEDLLLASRIEAGRLSLLPEVVPAGSLLDSVVSGLGSEAGRVRWVDEGLPDELVVDPQRLAQILTNLLVNAIKFSPPENGVVLRAGSRSPGTVTFTVEDRGSGIAVEELERIFDRFHQTESSSSHSEGAGLGLYIAKQLVEAMGGWIGVRSTPGRGSTFEVTIPASRNLPAPAPLSGAGRSGRTAS
jgi:signal transduction histidine kinase